MITVSTISADSHGPGRSLGRRIREHSGPLLRLVAAVESDLTDQASATAVLEALFGDVQAAADSVDEPMRLRAAWSLIAMLMTTQACYRRRGTAAELEASFFGGSGVCPEPPTRFLSDETKDLLELVLERIRQEPCLPDVLPYLLEPHGSEDRNTARRDPDAAARRDMKRAAGVYYTPGDVARTMVDELLRGRVTSTTRILDPACGTGVFLIACLAYLRSESPESLRRLDALPVYGLDKSRLAVDLCGFALVPTLHTLFSEMPLMALLRAVRSNLAVADSSTLVDSPSGGLPFAEPATETARALARVFPYIAGGFNVVVTNPPYTRVRASDGGTLYLAFLRLAARIVSPTAGAFGLVLPLTIAFSQSQEFAEARHEIATGGGTLRFTFFDREPGGLFGEEVKTRAAFVFRHYSGQGGAPEVFSSPLIRFTSRTRSATLRRLPAVSLDCWPVDSGVPRVGSASQSEAYRSLRSRGTTLALRASFRSASWAQLANEGRLGCVHVGGVAYNFLNVFVTPFPEPCLSLPASQSKIHSVTPIGTMPAFALLAYLSSSLPFWLWTIEGDGFHVGSKFIQALPWTSGLDKVSTTNDLAELGQKLWLKSKITPVVSINKQKWSLAFSARSAPDEVGAIDDLVFDALGIPKAVRSELVQALQTRIVIDAGDPRRASLIRSGDDDD